VPRPRLVVVAVLLATLAIAAVPAGAAGEALPGVDALVSETAKGSITTLVSPRLRTKNRHTLVLAFVVAGASGGSERVTKLSGDGLRWSRVASSDTRGGATEVWRAHASHWLSGRIVARLAVAAYPARITIVAYSGAAAYVASSAVSHGQGSSPRIRLRPVSGSLVWTMGLTDRQLTSRPVSSASPSKRILWQTFARRQRAGAWLALATVRTSHIATAATAGRARSWNFVAIDVVVPSLKRLIEEGLLTPYGAVRRAGSAAAASTLPHYCPPNPAFEVGVQDDPVFLGLQPAMSPTHGFELATRVFHARLLRLNVIWGEVKLHGWGPYDRAIQMAWERCWMIHLTIMPTPVYAERYLNSELSGRNLNLGLFASFAAEIASRYKARVARFGIGNEPDEGKFIPQSENVSANIATYDRMYIAGYNAVKSSDPGAEVIAGEIGSKDIFEWLSNIATLPSSGVSIHPYGLTAKFAELVKYVAPVPLLMSEDGVKASVPNQIEQDLWREEVARHAGVKEFVFYELSRADATEHFWWDTGIE
jgi:hypothetical protein